MEHDEGLTVTHTVIGRAGKAALTVRVNGKAEKVTTANVLDEGERAELMESLQKEFPALAQPNAAAELTRILLAIAEDVARQLAGGNSRSREAVDGLVQRDPRELLAAMPEDVRDEGNSLLADPDLVQHIIEDAAALGVAGECKLAATVYLLGTSRLLAHPLAAIVQGPSSSGKSFTIRQVACLFPPEAVIHATKMTPEALFHMEPGLLSHRFIVAGERSRARNDDTAEATRALREMLSEGRLSKLMPIKVAGGIHTACIEQEGPIAYIESTTLVRIDDEDLNRCVLLSTDEQPEQTRRVLRRLASRMDPEAWVTDTERIVLRHRALQRMLVVEPIVIPYVGRLADCFPDDRVEARRVFGHLLNMVESIVLLHQRQRRRDDSGRLIATADDYRLAAHLMAGPVARQLGAAVSDGARRFLDRIQRADLGDPFTAQQVAKAANVSDRGVRGHFSELSRAGYLELVEPGRGPVPHRWRLAPKPPADHGWAGLPTLEEIMPGGDFRLSDRGQVSVPAILGSVAAGLPGTSG